MTVLPASRPCVKCGAELAFVPSAKTGTPMPLEPAPHDRGTVLVDELPDGRRFATALNPARAAELAAGRPLYRAHFAARCHESHYRGGPR